MFLYCIYKPIVAERMNSVETVIYVLTPVKICDIGFDNEMLLNYLPFCLPTAVLKFIFRGSDLKWLCILYVVHRIEGSRVAQSL
jgi:hypothetical protein